MKKVGILCASDDELAPFLPHIEACSVTEKAMLKIYEGVVNGVPVAALYSGVGKVNAAIAAQILIDTFGVTCILNAGAAGGMDETLQILDTVITTRSAYHDMAEDILTEFHPWMSSVYFEADRDLLALAQQVAHQRAHIYFGTIVTGEQFIKDEGRAEINGKFAPLCVDMETASVAHVCYVNKVPFLAVRTITDTAQHSGEENFEQNCEKASALAKDITLDLLAKM